MLQILETLIALIALFFALRLTRHGLKKISAIKHLDHERTNFVYKILKVSLLILAAIVVISIWDLDPENLWVFVGSVLGIIAIGFFAVWSILSNVVAGFFLFFSNVFKLTDRITVIPDDISGTVIDLKLLFVVLQDENGDTIHIPNNLLMQKIIKRSKPAASKNEQENK